MAGNRESIIEQVTAIAERVAASAGIEIVNVEFVGGGRNRVLRLFIDRPPANGLTVPLDAPSGATLEDCELISRELSDVLDTGDVIPGEAYKLEVSSPGVERKLSKLIEFQRFAGHPAKIWLTEPADGMAHWQGVLKGVTGDVVHLEAAGGKTIDFPFAHLSKAHLKFRW